MGYILNHLIQIKKVGCKKRLPIIMQMKALLVVVINSNDYLII